MTNEKHIDTEASFDSTYLEELSKHVKRVLDIRDRKYGLPPKTYPKCFVGNEAVEKMVTVHGNKNILSVCKRLSHSLHHNIAF